MKIRIYTKSKDLKFVAEHIKKFLTKHSKDKNRNIEFTERFLTKKNQIELRKCSMIDSFYYGFGRKYQEIVIFYTDAILAEELLKHIAKLSTAIIDIGLVIRYLKDNLSFDNETYIPIDNYADILDFVEVANNSIGADR